MGGRLSVLRNERAAVLNTHVVTQQSMLRM